MIRSVILILVIGYIACKWLDVVLKNKDIDGQA